MDIVTFKKRWESDPTIYSAIRTFYDMYPEEAEYIASKYNYRYFCYILIYHIRYNDNSQFIYEIYTKEAHDATWQKTALEWVNWAINEEKSRQSVKISLDKSSLQDKKTTIEVSIKKVSATHNYNRGFLAYAKEKYENVDKKRKKIVIPCVEQEASLETVNIIKEDKTRWKNENVNFDIRDDFARQILFILFESDENTLREQLRLHKWLESKKLLYRAVFSGNKSIHFLIKVCVLDYVVKAQNEYKQICSLIGNSIQVQVKHDINLNIKFDKNCWNLGKLTRKPFAKRELEDGRTVIQKVISFSQAKYYVPVSEMFNDEKQIPPPKRTPKKSNNSSRKMSFSMVCEIGDQYFIRGQRYSNMSKFVGTVKARNGDIEDVLKYIDEKVDNPQERKDFQKSATFFWDVFE